MSLRAVALAGLVALGLPGCVIVLKGDDTEASGPFLSPAPQREERALDPFRRVLVEGAVDVELRVGVPQAVRVEGDRGRLGEVRTEVRDAVLCIAQPVEFGRFRDGPRVVVDVPALDGLVAAGSGWVAVSGLDQVRLEVELRGSGDVLLRGAVGTLDARVTGAGQLDADGLAADAVRIDEARPGAR